MVLKYICDTVASKIGSERECLLSLFPRRLAVLSSTAALIASLLLTEGTEVCLEQLGGMSLKPGSIDRANILF